MQNDESVLREQLHHHLQAYRGQTFSYEMARELMSFVSEMEQNHLSISWVSKDSLIRLLNSIFKKVGQKMDDKSIAGIEESVLTALVFYAQNDTYDSTGRPLQQSIKTSHEEKPSEKAGQIGNLAGGVTMYEIENAYQRLLQEWIAFENRIARIVEKTVAESQDVEIKMIQERKDLEAKWASERSALDSRLAKERIAQESRLTKERAEMAEMLNRFLARHEERLSKTENMFDEGIQSMESNVAGIQAICERIATEQAGKWEGSANLSKSFFDAFAQRMDQKFNDIEEKIASGKKAARRLTALSVLEMIAIAVGFIVVYLLK